MDKKNHVDFVSAVVMGLLAIFVMAESVRMYFDSGEVFYYSPGLLSFIMGAGLFICSVMLWKRSVKDTSISEIYGRLKQGAKEFFSSRLAFSSFVGLALMGLYVYVLLQVLGFIIATWIFLVALMLFLRAGSIVKIILISTLTVAITYVLFQIVFGVPLPEPASFIKELIG